MSFEVLAVLVSLLLAYSAYRNWKANYGARSKRMRKKSAEKGGTAELNWMKPKTWSGEVKIGVSLLPLVGMAVAIFYSGSLHPFFFIALAIAGALVWKLWREDNPPTWAMVPAISIPLFVWGFQVAGGQVYQEWRESGYFWWMIATATALSWLGSSSAKKAYAGLVLLLLIAVGIGAYGVWEDRQLLAEEARVAEIQAILDSGRYPCPFEFQVTLTKEFGQTISRSAGCHFVIERLAPVGYQLAAVTPEGDALLSAPVGQESRQAINALSFRLRIAPEEMVEELPVQISLYRR
jgi:hypothetical protein